MSSHTSKSADYVRYRMQVARERMRIQATGLTPYEEAVQRVEAMTGQPRAEWEHHLNHDNTLEANRIARDIAGIPELPMSMHRSDAMQPRRHRVSSEHAA